LFLCVIALGLVIGCGEDITVTNTDGGPCYLQEELFGGVPDETPAHKAVLAISSDHRRCSGTLIAPKRVVTAAHCCIYDKRAEVITGRDSVMGTASMHPQYKRTGELSPVDLCVIELDQPLNIEPMAVAESAPALEALVTTVGFGVNKIDDCTGAETGNGVRRQGNVVVTNITPDVLETHPLADDPAVFSGHGDSGGALLFRGDDGIERLIGVTRSGDSKGLSQFINAVTNRDWIRLDHRINPR
ncbi:MAG: trypsin-like serine protease, partial [bacterium]|nr:trypsin-like serine protease [bacterium]